MSYTVNRSEGLENAIAGLAEQALDSDKKEASIEFSDHDGVAVGSVEGNSAGIITVTAYIINAMAKKIKVNPKTLGLVVASAAEMISEREKAEKKEERQKKDRAENPFGTYTDKRRADKEISLKDLMAVILESEDTED